MTDINLKKRLMNPRIEYIDASERFGMSGPFIGRLKVDGVELKEEFLHQNFITSIDDSLIVFNRFEGYKSIKRFFGLVQARSSERVFRILIFDQKNNIWHLSKSSWNSLFVTRYHDAKVYFTSAFHDGDRSKFPEQSLQFNDENFYLVKAEEIFL